MENRIKYDTMYNCVTNFDARSRRGGVAFVSEEEVSSTLADMD
jgi:hypothetical protein